MLSGYSEVASGSFEFLSLEETMCRGSHLPNAISKQYRLRACAVLTTDPCICTATSRGSLGGFVVKVPINFLFVLPSDLRFWNGAMSVDSAGRRSVFGSVLCHHVEGTSGNNDPGKEKEDFEFFHASQVSQHHRCC
jgi:hypothetical protein